MLTRGGGSDADQKKNYREIPDPVVHQQAKAGPLKLPESYLREVGNNFLARNCFNDAFKYFDRAVKVGSESLHVSYCARAAAHAQLGRWEESMHDARRAVALSTSYPKGYLLLGEALCQLGRHAEALYAFHQGLKHHPKDLLLSAAKTDARGRFEGDIDFQDVIKRAELGMKAANYIEALKWFSQAICLCPDDSKSELTEIYIKRAQCWKEAGDSWTCLEDCEEAKAQNDVKELDQSRVETLTHEAQDSLSKGDAKKVVDMKSKLVKPSHMDPDSTEYVSYHFGYR